MERVVAVEVRGSVGIAWLNRSGEGNVWGWDMCNALEDAYSELDARTDVRAIVLAGRGRHFCAGMDLHSLATLAEAGHPTIAGVPADSAGRVVLRSMSLRKPLLVAMHGACIGVGTTMTLGADIRIAGESTRFAVPFARLGVTPEGLSSWLLPRIVGVTKALEWLVTGRTFDAYEAMSAGLISRVVPDDQVLNVTLELAMEIAAATAPTSVANTRQLVWRALLSDSPTEIHRLESLLLSHAVQGDDARAAVSAFQRKQAPSFETEIEDWLSLVRDSAGESRASSEE